MGSCRTGTVARAVLAMGALVLGATLRDSARALTVSQSLALSADVQTTCSINASSELSLGVYDVGAAAPLDGSGTLTVTCSNGAPALITLGQGMFPDAGSTNAVPLRRMSAGGFDRLTYDLYRDAARTQPWGNTALTGVSLTGSSSVQPVNIFARIPAGQAVASGSYQDSVLATVSY